jgi:hypothetical protein
MSVDLIFNDDATRSVSLSQLNSATRRLKGQGVTEMDKSEPSAGRDTGPRSGPDREAKPITAKKATKDAADMLTRAVRDSHKKKDVKEGILGSDPNRGQKVPDWAKGGIIGKIGRKLDPAWSDVQTTVPQHLLSKKSDVPDKKSPAAKDMPKATSITPTGAIPKRARTKPSHSGTKNVVKTIADKPGVSESNTLMDKLHRAMVKEGRVKELADDLKTMADADFMKKYGKAKAAIRKDMNKLDETPINELGTNKLAQYKTAAAKDAQTADKAGDVKRGDKRFSGIVKATKKQFDNDAKKVDESRAARRALMAQIVKGN